MINDGHTQYALLKKRVGFTQDHVVEQLTKHGFSPDAVSPNDMSYTDILKLIAYISQAQQKGLSNTIIQESLLHTGWKKDDVNEAMQICHSIGGLQPRNIKTFTQKKKSKSMQKGVNPKVDLNLQEIDFKVDSQLQKTSQLLSQLRQKERNSVIAKIRDHLYGKKHFYSNLKKKSPNENNDDGKDENNNDKKNNKNESLKKQLQLEKKKNQLTNKQFEQLQQVIEGLNNSLMMQSSLQMQNQMAKNQPRVPIQPQSQEVQKPKEQDPVIIGDAPQLKSETPNQTKEEPVSKIVEEEKTEHHKQNEKVVKLSSQYKNPSLQIQSDSVSVTQKNPQKSSGSKDLASLEQKFQSMGNQSAGFGFYNQVVPDEIKYTQEPIGDRAQTGIPDLDLVIDGGFVRYSQTLVSGGPGTGKSTFALQYLIDGVVLYNEPGVYVTFEQSREAIIALGKQFGWDIENLEKQDMLVIHEYTPEQVYKALKSGGGSFRDLIDSIHAKRIAVDSITEYLMLFSSEMAQRREITDFYKLISRWNCTGVFVGEEDSNAVTKKASVLDYESDAVILLYNERKGDIRQRALEIFKMRGTKHAGRIFPIKMTDSGIVVDVKSSQIYRV